MVRKHSLNVDTNIAAFKKFKQDRSKKALQTCPINSVLPLIKTYLLRRLVWETFVFVTLVFSVVFP